MWRGKAETYLGSYRTILRQVTLSFRLMHTCFISVPYTCMCIICQDSPSLRSVDGFLLLRPHHHVKECSHLR